MSNRKNPQQSLRSLSLGRRKTPSHYRLLLVKVARAYTGDIRGDGEAVVLLGCEMWPASVCHSGRTFVALAFCVTTLWETYCSSK